MKINLTPLIKITQKEKRRSPRLLEKENEKNKVSKFLFCNFPTKIYIFFYCFISVNSQRKNEI